MFIRRDGDDWKACSDGNGTENNDSIGMEIRILKKGMRRKISSENVGTNKTFVGIWTPLTCPFL